MKKQKAPDTDEEVVLEGEVYIDENGEVVFKIPDDPEGIEPQK